jgi:hypothetical protein
VAAAVNPLQVKTQAVGLVATAAMASHLQVLDLMQL